MQLKMKCIIPTCGNIIYIQYSIGYTIRDTNTACHIITNEGVRAARRYNNTISSLVKIKNSLKMYQWSTNKVTKRS